MRTWKGLKIENKTHFGHHVCSGASQNISAKPWALVCKALHRLQPRHWGQPKQRAARRRRRHPRPGGSHRRTLGIAWCAVQYTWSHDRHPSLTCIHRLKPFRFSHGSLHFQYPSCFCSVLWTSCKRSTGPEDLCKQRIGPTPATQHLQLHWKHLDPQGPLDTCFEVSKTKCSPIVWVRWWPCCCCLPASRHQRLTLRTARVLPRPWRVVPRP
jgi:hypothetical protein